MTTTDSDVCKTCNSTHPMPDGTMPKHPFNDGSLSGISALKSAPKVQESPWPFDPVLRQALINKEIITPDDLTEAEAHIRAVTAQVLKGLPR